jgi:hypothetical protein
VTFSIVLQIPILVLAALMLDGGRLLGVVSIATVAYWMVTLQIMFRRPATPTRVDIVFIRFGVLLLSAVTVFVAPFVWDFIGESTRSGLDRLLSR